MVFMPSYYIGLMSGTSLDAIDTVLVEFNETSCKQLACLSTPFSADLKQQLSHLTFSGNHEIERLALAEPLFAKACADSVNELLKQSGFSPSRIIAIGSHGQTLRHRPEKGYTLQIGDPSLIAELTGIDVVADFRRRDIAAGGQGAPLVPAFHKAVFSSSEEDRVIVNIGGMSNITVLTSSSEAVRGFDTGPGNILMDHWSQRHLGQPYDKEGQWAASAHHDDKLLSLMLKDPFFSAPPPKSTGRERFNPQWLKQQLEQMTDLPHDCVAATLCRLTARSIARGISQYAPDTQSVYVCGGGARNQTLMNRLGEELEGIAITSTAELSIDPDWVESVAFAWLAKQAIERQPVSLATVTGASGNRILGAIYPA